MVIVMKGIPNTDSNGMIQRSRFNRTIGQQTVGVQVMAEIFYEDVTDDGVFLTTEQVRELTMYGMADSETAQLLRAFIAKNSLVEKTPTEE